MHVESTSARASVFWMQPSIIDYKGLAEEVFNNSPEQQKLFLDQIQLFSANPSEGIGEFLICICRNIDRSSKEKYAVMSSLASHISFNTSMHDLFLYKPLEFLQVFRYLDEEVAQQIIGCLAENFEGDFFGSLQACTTVLCEDQTIYRPKKLLSAFFNGMPASIFKDFVEHIVKVSSLADLAQITMFLKEDKHLDAFMQAFLSQYDDDDFNDSFGTLVEEICSNIIKKRPRFLERFLRDEQNNWICRRVIDDFAEYSPFSQACLVWCIDSESRKKIAINLQNSPDLIQNCLETIFRMEDSMRFCIRLVADLTHGFNEDNLLNFVIGLVTSETPSCVVPYLYSGLPVETFWSLILCGPDMHLKMLEQSLPENVAEIVFLAKDLNKCPAKLEVLFSQMALTLSDDATLVPFADFMKNASSLKNQDQLSAFLSAFQRVPPFLLALAMANPGYSSTIFKFINCLTDKQHKAIGAVLPLAGLIPTLERLVPPNLHYNSYAAIVTSLSEDNLKIYLAFKNRELLQKFVAFVRSFSQFQKDCQSALDLKDSKIDPQAFGVLIQSLLDRGHILNGFITRYLSPDYETLEKLTKELVFDNQEEDYTPFLFEKLPINKVILCGQGPAYETLMKHLGEQNNVIPKACSISNILGFCGQYRILISERIRFLSGLLPATQDDTDSISLEYWEVLTLQNLNALNGIKNASEIFDLGIRSDKDFNHLGASLANKKKLEEIQKKIQSKFGTTHTICMTARIIWEKLLNPKVIVDSEECNQLVTELVNVYQIPSHKPIELTGFSLSLIQQMHTFDELTNLERTTLVNLQTMLPKISNPSETFQHCHQTLCLSINIIKRQELLSVLKRYLSQPDLSVVWNSLQIRGIKSISELGIRGNVLFNLKASLPQK